MMQKQLTAALAAATLGIGAIACGGGPDPAAVAEGHKLFESTCATCHGPNGEGVPKLGKNLNQNDFIATLSDDELVAFLEKGRSAGDPLNERGVDMPPKGGNPVLTDGDLALIVAYMRSLQ